MRQQVGADFGVKASGGIRTLTDAVAMISAGANRLGTSKTKEILAELKKIKFTKMDEMTATTVKQ